MFAYSAAFWNPRLIKLFMWIHGFVAKIGGLGASPYAIAGERTYMGSGGRWKAERRDFKLACFLKNSSAGMLSWVVSVLFPFTVFPPIPLFPSVLSSFVFISSMPLPPSLPFKPPEKVGLVEACRWFHCSFRLWKCFLTKLENCSFENSSLAARVDQIIEIWDKMRPWKVFDGIWDSQPKHKTSLEMRCGWQT